MTRVYVGNPITGKMGSSATIEYMQRNCAIAKEIVRILKAVFPNVDFFAPAAHDNIVQRLFAGGKITIQDILEADHQEQKARDKTLLITWEESAGCWEEKEYSESIRQPCMMIFERRLVDPINIVYSLPSIKEFLGE